MGIGTTDPTQKLQVSGGNTYLDLYNNGTTTYGLYLRNPALSAGKNMSILARGLGSPSTPDGLEING